MGKKDRVLSFAGFLVVEDARSSGATRRAWVHRNGDSQLTVLRQSHPSKWWSARLFVANKVVVDVVGASFDEAEARFHLGLERFRRAFGQIAA